MMMKLIIVSVLWGFIGCSGKGEVMMAKGAPVMQAYSEAMPMSDKGLVHSRIITRHANIDVEVKSIHEAKEALNRLLEKEKGYIVNANEDQSGYFNASIKVPSLRLDATLLALGSIGTKLSQSVSQNDITTQYVDTQARLKNLLLFKEKMQTLLERARKIEDVLRIERELGRVQTEIDAIEGQMKYMKNAVDMSPISVSFEEETMYGPLGYLGNGLWWVVKKLFVIK